MHSTNSLKLPLSQAFPQALRRNPRRALAIALAALLTLAALLAWLAPPSFLRRGQTVDHIDQTRFEAETGVHLSNLAITAAGGMIDLRVRTLDPNKAVILHDDQFPPRIIDEASGTTLSRPWHEHNDTDLPTPGVVYSTLILNAGNLIHRGSLVTVIIGQSRLEHVIVQ